MFDYDAAQTELKILYQAASALKGWHKDQAGRFITVGEYGLALDSIAYAYLGNNILMPTDLFSRFENLATSMDLESEPEFQGVARLRKAQAHSA